MEAEMEDRLQSMTQYSVPVQSSSSGVTTTTVPRASSKGNNTKVIYAPAIVQFTPCIVNRPRSTW